MEGSFSTIEGDGKVVGNQSKVFMRTRMFRSMRVLAKHLEKDGFLCRPYRRADTECLQTAWLE